MVPDMNTKSPLTIAAASEYLGISAKSVRRLLASRQLPFLRIGPRLVRIRSADLDAFITARTVQSKAS
jgi:excisionase family DNA binding protein